MMTTETSNTADRRVYVACLGAYNSGRLVGEWLDTCGIDERVPELIKAWRAQGLRDHGEDWGDEVTQLLLAANSSALWVEAESNASVLPGATLAHFVLPTPSRAGAAALQSAIEGGRRFVYYDIIG